MWVMGFSLSVSFKNKLRHAVPRRQLVFLVIRRSIILIFLGFMLNSHGRIETLETVRYPGVLQRIGFSYLIVGIIEAALAKRSFSIIQVSNCIIKYIELILEINCRIVIWPFFKI